jgi:hypothetical protein
MTGHVHEFLELHGGPVEPVEFPIDAGRLAR